MIQELTQKIVACQPMSDEEIESAAEEMMSGNASIVQMAAFLTALHIRGEDADQIAGFARVLRHKAVPFHRRPGTVLDTCGTGGDHSGTFNISTASAFVAAGAGVRVAKHGNRSMTSKCGSADVLTELGISIDCQPAVMERALDEAGICFLFAQQYHHSMKHVGPVRRELGFRTIFNLLGPLLNPAQASHQLIGVFRRDLTVIHARVLARLGTKRALVVHGSDGLDEITTTGPSWVAEVNDGWVRSFEISPEEFAIAKGQPGDLAGGEPPQNAEIIRGILNGEQGPRTDIVLLNAGAAIYVAEQAGSISEGIDVARHSIASGAAKAKLQHLCRITSPAEAAR